MSCFKTVLSVELTELAAVIEFMHLSLAGGLFNSRFPQKTKRNAILLHLLRRHADMLFLTAFNIKTQLFDMIMHHFDTKTLLRSCCELLTVPGRKSRNWFENM